MPSPTTSAALRPATAADHARYASFQAELGVGDPPLPAERWERECAPRTVFLVAEAREIGYAFFELAGEHAYVRHVVVDAAARGRGFGRLLMRELAARLAAEGVREWRLNVLRSNRAAIALYASLGLSAVHSTEVLRLAWDDVGRLAESDSTAEDLSDAGPDTGPDADRELERRFAVMPGQVAFARSRAGVRVLLARTPAGLPVGLAVFDPAFPGSFPFRCAPGGPVRTLVAAMRERYDGERPYLQLVVEDAAEVAAELAAAGAVRVHDIVHMRGTLPR